MKKSSYISSLWILIVLIFEPSWVEAKEAIKYHYVLPNYTGAGLFAVFNTVIGFLDDYEKTRPSGGISVDFGSEGFYYSPEKGPNWWTYYFEPIQLGNKKNAKIVIVQPTQISVFCNAGACVVPLLRAHELIKKYIKVRPEIKKTVEQFVQAHFQDHVVIGVHYRGTDKFVVEAPYVAYGEVVSKLDAILKQIQKPAKIFVATDEAPFLDFMKGHYKSQVISQEIHRSTNSAPLHFNHHDKYQSGLDAVVDCLLLSRCHVLLKTASNLSACSRMFNPNIQVVHLSQNNHY